VESKEVKKLLKEISEVLTDIQRKNISIETMEIFKKGSAVAEKIGNGVRFTGIMEDGLGGYIYLYNDDLSGSFTASSLKEAKNKLKEMRLKFEKPSPSFGEK
jgi:hypothetical protein